MPAGTLGAMGVTEIDTGTGLPTVSVVEPLSPWNVAVIVVVPTPRAVARPVMLSVATAMFDVDHIDVAVTFLWVPFEKMAVAVN